MDDCSTFTGFVYLLHLERPLNRRTRRDRRTVQHYIGYTDDLAVRIQKHRTGNGSRFMQVAKQRGIDFQVARVWRGDRSFERRLKGRKQASRLCPFCTPELQIDSREFSPEQIAEVLIPF